MALVKPQATYAICYHDGAFVDWSQATVHAGALAMRYALSVFEGIRLYRGREGTAVHPFALGPHVRRFAESLRLMRLPDPGVAALPGIIAELVARNGIDEDSYVRAAASATSFGEMSADARTSLTVTVTRMGRKKWLAEDRRMRVTISSWQRASAAVFPHAAKNISSYAGPRLALLEARDAGYDSTILRNAEGYLCEAPTAALFIVRRGVVSTPPLADGPLPSITRQVLLELCGALGIPAEEAHLRPADLLECDEAFLCGTGIEIAPIGSVDGRTLRHAADLPLTRRLLEAYFERARTTGENP
jgi:branched-chain amino acid aminotransferase